MNPVHALSENKEGKKPFRFALWGMPWICQPDKCSMKIYKIISFMNVYIILANQIQQYTEEIIYYDKWDFFQECKIDLTHENQ